MDLRIIEEETSVLGDADAARADQVLAGAAPGLTFGEVRRAARTLVLRLDPEAAKKRKEAARGEAHVRRFREASGNAGMVARELPSDEVLASWQHVEQRALDLRAAGAPRHPAGAARPRLPRPACATRRSAVSPVQRAKTRGVVFGSDGLLQPERVLGGK